MSILANIAGTESGGDYGATNARTGAAGKYQILPSNWPSWSKEAGLPAGSKMTPANQEKVASFKLSQYVDKYGEQGAAVAWYAGESAAKAWLKNPDAPRFNKKQGNGNEPSINEYVASTVGSGGNQVTGVQTAPPTTTETVDPKPSPQSSPAEVEAYIRKHYPDAAPFIQNDEIRKILFTAATSPVEVDPDEIKHQIRQTTYWQTHGVDSQAFDKLIGTNPAEAGALVDNAKQTLADFFDQQGVKYNDSQLGDAAKKSIRAGWVNTAGQIANPRALNDFAVFALNQQNPNGGLPSGAAASKADQLAQIAHDYLVPVNRQDLERAALDIQAGRMTQDQFVHNIAEQSKSLFHGSPQTVQQIDSGQTPYAIFAPQRTAIGKYFEVDANSIDLTDPKWADVLQMHDDAAKTTRPMTYGETIKWAMQNAPKNTQWFEQTDAAVANTLAKALGKVAS